MSGAASLLQGQGSNGALARADRLPSNILKRRAGQRRQMLGVEAVSYSLSTLVLLVYCYAGTISMVVPAAYFVSGITLVGFFVVLSESLLIDTFQTHLLPHFLLTPP